MNWLLRSESSVLEGYLYPILERYLEDIISGNYREWIDKNVGTRAGRLAEDSEIMVRQELNDIDVKFDEGLFATAREMFEKDKQFKSLFTQFKTKKIE